MRIKEKLFYLCTENKMNVGKTIFRRWIYIVYLLSGVDGIESMRDFRTGEGGR